MEMTELQECLEVSVLSVPLPLGNVCHPALRKCHYWFVSMRWQHCRARPLQEHAIYNFKCRYLLHAPVCVHTPRNTNTFQFVILDSLISLILCPLIFREGEEVSTHNTQRLHTVFAIDQMVMAFKEWLHALRKASDQREKEAQFSCVSFHPIYFKADTVFFFPPWSGLCGILNEWGEINEH